MFIKWIITINKILCVPIELKNYNCLHVDFYNTPVIIYFYYMFMMKYFISHFQIVLGKPHLQNSKNFGDHSQF